MREGVGDDIALAAPLQSIIVDGRSRLHGRLDIAGLDETPLLLRVVRPHSGKAVGLQLDSHLQFIGLDLVHAALRLLYLGQDSQQILHVVADLVRNHVGLGELAALASDIAAAETPLEILKERGIQIDLPINGTIERTHGGLGKAACRARGAGEHDERRALVGSASLRENLFPLDFRASQHSRYELTHLIGWSFRLGTAGSGLRLLLRAAQAGQNLRPADQIQRIDAQCPADDDEQDDRANPNAAGAAHGKAPRSAPAPIFYLVAARQLVQAHITYPSFVHLMVGCRRHSRRVCGAAPDTPHLYPPRLFYRHLEWQLLL